MASGQTPSQTIGPYFAYGLTPQQYGYDFNSIADGQVADDTTDGTRIRIEGQVIDGEGNPVDDAMIEIWQADHLGRFDFDRTNTTFTGFGRSGTGSDDKMLYVFETVKPGPCEEGHAPCVSLIVFLRGLLSHAYTRMYFPDEEAANASDPVLQSAGEDRRHTLIATRSEGEGGCPVYRFDIHMQGEAETVFFDV